jgi:hypothetical protein
VARPRDLLRLRLGQRLNLVVMMVLLRRWRGRRDLLRLRLGQRLDLVVLLLLRRDLLRLCLGQRLDLVVVLLLLPRRAAASLLTRSSERSRRTRRRAPWCCQIGPGLDHPWR